MTVIMVVMMVVIATLVLVMMAAMILRGTIMRRVIVPIALRGVRMTATGIGASFGIERRFDFDHAGP
jgi:hypothetical protein